MVLKRIIKSSIEKANSLIPKVENEIDEIIKNKVSDKNKIELTLDYLMHPLLENQFNKLLKYYKTVDAIGAEEYKKVWNEFYSN